MDGGQGWTRSDVDYFRRTVFEELHPGLCDAVRVPVEPEYDAIVAAFHLGHD